MESVLADAVKTIGNSKDFTIGDFVSKNAGEAVNQHMPEHRNRSFPPEVTMACMIQQVLTPNGSLSKTLTQINADRARKNQPLLSANTGGLSKARSRLSLEFIREMAQGQAYNAADQAPKSWLWNGFQVKAIDGSTVTATDTEANQKSYPQHGQQGIGIGNLLLRIVVLQSLFTGLIEECEFAAFQGKGTGEMSLASPIVSKVKQGDLILGDRYYPSFFFIAQIIMNGGEGLFQAHALREVDFRRGKKLGPKDHTVEWKKPPKPKGMQPSEYEAFPDSLTLRECATDPSGRRKDGIILITTLLDHEKFPVDDLAELYRERWKIELALRDLKTVLGIDHIEARSPEMIAKEIWCYMLAYNYVRWFMANTAVIGKGKIWEVSFQLTLNLILANQPNFLAAKTEDETTRIRGSILLQLINNPIKHRPGRREPRAVKKRPKPQRRLQESRRSWHERHAP